MNLTRAQKSHRSTRNSNAEVANCANQYALQSGIIHMIGKQQSAMSVASPDELVGVNRLVRNNCGAVIKNTQCPQKWEVRF